MRLILILNQVLIYSEGMLDFKTASDELLVRKIHQGKSSAFDELYCRYKHRLFKYIGFFLKDSRDAEELLQEIFIKVIKEHPAALSEGCFAGWLFKIARNQCLEHIRTNKRRNNLSQDYINQSKLAINANDPVETSPSLPLGKKLTSIVTSLPETHQQVLLLKVIAELNYRDIALIQGVPEGTVKSRLHFAISTVRRMLSGQEGQR